MTLLESQDNSSFISWTGKGLEFKLVEPEEVGGLKKRVWDERVKDFVVVWAVLRYFEVWKFLRFSIF